MISHACLTFVHHSFHCIPSHASLKCLSICPSNSCHMIACATYIIANISKPTRMATPAHLENYFDKPSPHSDSYSIHNVKEQIEHSPMHLAIDVLHFNSPCSKATGIAQPCWVPQMAPFTSSQLSMSDHSLSCSAIDLHHSGPCPTVTVKKAVLGK